MGIVLGIDPGTAVTGYGVVSRGEDGTLSLLECGVIRTSAGEPLPRRIREIFLGIQELIERFQPSAVSVEDVFQGKNVRSALTLGHARGAILLAAALQELPIAEYSPREIKKAVVGTGGRHQGSGRLHGAATPSTEGALPLRPTPPTGWQRPSATAFVSGTHGSLTSCRQLPLFGGAGVSSLRREPKGLSPDDRHTPGEPDHQRRAPLISRLRGILLSQDLSTLEIETPGG